MLLFVDPEPVSWGYASLLWASSVLNCKKQMWILILRTVFLLVRFVSRIITLVLRPSRSAAQWAYKSYKQQWRILTLQNSALSVAAQKNWNKTLFQENSARRDTQQGESFVRVPDASLWGWRLQRVILQKVCRVWGAVLQVELQEEVSWLCSVWVNEKKTDQLFSAMLRSQTARSLELPLWWRSRWTQSPAG